MTASGCTPRSAGSGEVNITSKIRVRTQISPAALDAMKGKIIADDGSGLDFLLTGPTEVRSATGDLLCIYLPGVLRGPMFDSMYDVLHGLKAFETDNRGLAGGSGRVNTWDDVNNRGSRSRGTAVASAIIGSFDPGGQKRYCRLTAWTGRENERFRTLYPLFQEIGRQFAAHVPDRFEAQMRYIRETAPDWVIEGTPFTTITVNNSYSTGVHTDKGDLDEGFSTLSVLRRGNYSGGIFTFVENRFGVDMQDGDLLLMDAHRWHGNTAMRCNVCGDIVGPNGTTGHDERCGTERISIVSYYRTKMKDCGTADEEYDRAVAYAEKRVAINSADPERIRGNSVVEEMAAEAVGEGT